MTTVVKLKESIEEQKFANGDDHEAVREWADRIEQVVNEGHACIRELAVRIEQIDLNLRHATALYEHKREVELEKEKKQEALNRVHAKELEFQKKKLVLKQAQTEPPQTVQMASNVFRFLKHVIKKIWRSTARLAAFWGTVQKSNWWIWCPWSNKVLLFEGISEFEGAKSHR